MKTQITYMKSKCRFGFITTLITFLLFSFGSLGQNINTSLIETWVSGNWTNSIMAINTYDSNNYLTNTLSQNWNTGNSTWENFSQANYTNNSNGTVNQMILQTWNDGPSIWENAQRITYTYNASNKVLTSVSDIWFNNNWLGFSKIINTYDTNGYLTNSLTQTWDFVGPWKNNSQINYTNNPNGTVDYSISQSWNLGTNVWDNFQKVSYTYNSNDKVLTKTTQTWEMGNWANLYKDMYTYDSSGYLITELRQNWIVASSTWINASQSIFTNNTNGTPSQITSQTWNTAGSVWLNEMRITLTYNILSNGNFDNEKIFTVYPIPARDKITIKSNENIQGLTYFIVDQTGRRYMSGTMNTEETTIDINRLSTGIYFFQIGQNTNQTVKIIKQ